MNTNDTPFYLSRTFWVNLLAVLSLMIPCVREWVDRNPVEPLAALGSINVLLKFITLGKYEIKGIMLPIMISFSLLAGALTSCGHRMELLPDGGILIEKNGIVVKAYVDKAGKITPITNLK